MTKIYFDMDGVLADFDRGVKELCGLEPLDQNSKNRSQTADDHMWEEIKKIDHFYDRLEPMPGAIEMFKTIYARYGDRCEILSGIPKPRRGILTSGEDKTNWVHRLLGESIKVNIVFREDKYKYCSGADYLLIDDMEKNINEWVEMGGTGILHKSSEETLSHLREGGII